MKRIKKGFVIMLSLAFFTLPAFVTTGCNLRDQGDLSITFFHGGYGQAWAHALAARFYEEEGIRISINPDANLQIQNMLENGTEHDMIFSHNIPWELAAARANSLIVPICDVFDREVTPGVTFRDRMVPELVNHARLDFNGRLENARYFRVPWTNGAGGLVYNAAMFERHGWKVPTTYEELYALAGYIYERRIPVDPNDRRPNAPRIVPFAWKSNTYYWNYLVFNWWVQMQGLESFYDFKNLTRGADSFNPASDYMLPEAFGLWYNLVGRNPQFSFPNATGIHFMAAQQNFAMGHAAMMPNAQWFESEIREFINPEIFRPVMMETPAAPGAKTDENGEVIKVNFNVSDDSIIIPALGLGGSPRSAARIENAKKFLIFMARPDNARLFTEQTMGVMLPFIYTEEDLEQIGNQTDFSRSIFHINTTHYKFDLITQHPMVLANGELFLAYGPGPGGGHFYGDAYRHNNPTTASTRFNYMGNFITAHGRAVTNWNRWYTTANQRFEGLL